MTYLPQQPDTYRLADPADTLRELHNAVFLSDAEATLQLIVLHTKQVFERCRETLETTPTLFRAWLASSKEDQTYSRAFSWLDNASSFRTYTSKWTRLLCLIFRAMQLPQALESRLADALRRIPESVIEQLRNIWRVATKMQERESGRDQDSGLLDVEDDWRRSMGYTIETELQERLIKVSISLFTEHLPGWRQRTDSILLYFAGLLSIASPPRRQRDATKKPALLQFVPTSQSTTHLSNLIWLGRLFVLEYALPSRPYKVNPWPCRDTHVDQKDALEHFNTIRRKHLLWNGCTAFNEMLSLRKCGRRAQGQDGAQLLLRWSRDNTVIYSGPTLVPVKSFQSWIHFCAARTQARLQGLFEGYSVPTLPLLQDLKEDTRNQEPGVSFLCLPGNQQRLGACTEAFITQARISFDPKQKLSKKRALLYLKKQRVFLRSLLVTLQQTGGQPARGPELLSIKVCNTAETSRSLYVDSDMIYSQVQYNKTNNKTLTPFFVVRYYPPFVSQLLYQYLVYIRPFVRYLQQSLQLSRPEQPAYLWPAYHGLNIEPQLPSLLDGEDDKSDRELEDIERLTTHKAICQAEA